MYYAIQQDRRNDKNLGWEDKKAFVPVTEIGLTYLSKINKDQSWENIPSYYLVVVTIYFIHFSLSIAVL